MDPAPRPCPCCGSPLPLGLFSETAEVALPDPVAQMRAARVSDEQVSGQHVIIAGQRTFLRAAASMPLDNPASPVRVRVWAEVDDGAMLALSQAAETGASARVTGRLACEWPGFPGSLGSQVTVQSAPAGELPRIVGARDHRLRALKGALSHEHYMLIYRALFGGSAPVTDADLSLRAVTAAAWRDLAGRPTFTREIAPPAALAGIQPARLVIAPPLDTGATALIATVGIAEAAGERAVELAAWVRDPGAGFVDSFGEFCYLSRQMPAPEDGAVMREQPHIPDCENMVAWMFCRPWWADTPPVTHAGREVTLLAAVPIRERELEFAQGYGPRELAGRLELYDVDVADMHRDSVVD